MPAALAHRLPAWTARTLGWLRDHGARLLVSCGPEFWETAGALFPACALHRPDEPAERLPGAVPTGELTEREAEIARERYGLAEASVAAECARHPLALRLLADVRAALPGALPGAPGRTEILAAHTDLLCLRAAQRIAQGERAGDAAAVRRLAAALAGQVHRAARRCLAAADGALDRESFHALFPRSPGWAAAVLAEGLLVPAGSGYRFAHEELADWLQAVHTDLDSALDALVHGPAAAAQPPALLPPPAPDPAVPAQRAGTGRAAPSAPEPAPTSRPVRTATCRARAPRGLPQQRAPTGRTRRPLPCPGRTRPGRMRRSLCRSRAYPIRPRPGRRRHRLHRARTPTPRAPPGRCPSRTCPGCHRRPRTHRARTPPGRTAARRPRAGRTPLRRSSPGTG
ncbi:hypothetical protein [Streptomyces sp. CC228A]|uniref:hypothetical protein n=1 Tax=Streptomyces sp. CC228A TaxID=2898186 RepID=UPI001F307D1F|nr:hypothetical protein [Streptomyces sp. CC228A]